jgi:hypothetical protein
MDQIAVPRSIDGLPEAALAADCEPSLSVLATTRLRRMTLRRGGACDYVIASQRLGDDDASREVQRNEPERHAWLDRGQRSLQKIIGDRLSHGRRLLQRGCLTTTTRHSSQSSRMPGERSRLKQLSDIGDQLETFRSDSIRCPAKRARTMKAPAAAMRRNYSSMAAPKRSQEAMVLG